jgi:hypothetical protein
MNFSRLTTPQRVSAVSVAVIALGAFLPWVSIFGISKAGVEGDGTITLIVAIAGAVVLVATTSVLREGRTPGKASRIALVILAAIVALVALVDMNGAAAIGLYLTLFGGIAWVIGAAWELSTSKSQAATDNASADVE